MTHSSSSSHLETGAQGEVIACHVLEEKGMTVLHSNWRHKRDEVDIIAQDGDFLVFVEVKTRSSTAFGAPESWVDEAKQQKLIRAAQSYIEENGTEREIRFDVVSVLLADQKPEVLHIPDAFYPTLS